MAGLLAASLPLWGCGSGGDLTGASAVPSPTPTPDPGPPNIVVVVADDMGWGDPSSYGNTKIATPAIDSLAAEGVRFTEAYVPVPICAASRASFLTGLTPAHTRVWWNPPSVVDRGQPFMSELLREAGYSTGMAGKWHIEGYRPEERGFDWSAWTWNGTPVPNYSYARHYTALALQWVESVRAAGRPFFLYLCHHDPHLPNAAPPEYAGRSAAGLYGDTVEWLDAQVGVLLDGLKTMELERNTIVVFFSDNGPPKNVGFRGVLRGDKGSCLEGGVRIPMLVRWPLGIRGGRVLATPVSSLDWFPTFVTLARAPQLLADHHPDGLDLSPLLAGTTNVTTGSGIGGGRELLFFGPERLCGLRSGDMKYLRPGFWSPVFPILADVETDPRESTNLIDEQPDLADRLSRRLEVLEAQ